MKHLPLNEKQIEICDFILRNNNLDDIYIRLEENGYSEKDARIASMFLVDNKLITKIHPVVLTDIGAQWETKGIVRFLIIKRRREFFSLPVIGLIISLIAICITLIFKVVDYFKNHIGQ